MFIQSKFIFFTFILVLFFFPLYAPILNAGDPNSAYYSKYNDRSFWFIQISDIHIGASGTQDSYNLNWIVTEAKNVIQPEFIVATGDLTDSSNGTDIPVGGPYPAEWNEYFSLLSSAGMDENFYYDIPGNHDHYKDKYFAYYLNNSIQGRATGKTQASWRKDFPFGSYHFIGVCTAGNDGAMFSIRPADHYGDHAGLDQSELDFIETELANNQDVELTLIFGHHPLKPTGNATDTYLYYGTDEFTSLMETYGVSGYSFGHTHQFKEDLLPTPDGSGVYYLNVSSLGKASSNQYNIIAIDCNGISTVAQNINTWPVVLITAPLDKNYGAITNPYAYDLTNINPKPIRALVFDKSPVTQVRFRIDGGTWQQMFKVNADKPLWEGFWNDNWLTEGQHTIEVQAAGTSTRSHIIETNDYYDLFDAISAIQVLAGIVPPITVNKEKDINNDQKIGIEEVIFILQHIAGLR